MEIDLAMGSRGLEVGGFRSQTNARLRRELVGGELRHCRGDGPTGKLLLNSTSV